jgi:segregation and condensation protein A
MAGSADLAVDDFEAAAQAAPGEALVVDVEGFEGPLDLLLALARTQKLDLTHVSMLALAEQYLTFIEHAERLRLELAADYLVMAAWLAYLKSRLLLPKEEIAQEEVSGEVLAAELAFRLKRLEAMRQAGGRIMARSQLGRDVFARGMPEGVTVVTDSRYSATVYDLLKAYADHRRRTFRPQMQIRQRFVWSIKEARKRLEALIGRTGEWAALDRYLERYLVGPAERRTAIASSFGAILELAREGALELRQREPFGPIEVRRPGGGAG